MEEVFRFFIRKTWPKAGKELSNDVIDSMGIEFKEYLDKETTEDQRKKFMPLGEFDVISNLDNPLRVNGFHPAFTMHFTQFIKKLQDEENDNSSN
jgi:hypothetical protein